MKCSFMSVAVLSLGLGAAAQAAVLSDFESPVYAAGASWSGLDGWSGSAAFAKISPDVASGYTWVVEGQSGTLIGGSLRKSLGDAASQVASGVFDVSVSMQRPENPASASGAWYISDNLGVSRQAGIQFDRNDNGYQVLVWSGGKYNLIPTSTIAWAVQNSYLTTISLNTLTDTFTAYIKNLTTDGAVINLGTYSFDGGNLEAASFAAGGGIEVVSMQGATIYDNVTVVGIPEPASMAALGLVGVLIARRHRRNAGSM